MNMCNRVQVVWLSLVCTPTKCAVNPLHFLPLASNSMLQFKMLPSTVSFVHLKSVSFLSCGIVPLEMKLEAAWSPSPQRASLTRGSHRSMSGPETVTWGFQKLHCSARGLSRATTSTRATEGHRASPGLEHAFASDSAAHSDAGQNPGKGLK